MRAVCVVRVLKKRYNNLRNQVTKVSKLFNTAQRERCFDLFATFCVEIRRWRLNYEREFNRLFFERVRIVCTLQWVRMWTMICHIVV